MMKTLDRYIVRQYLMNFAILAVVLVGLFILIDVIIDLDEFIKAGRARAEDDGTNVLLGTLVAAVDFYGPLLLLMYVFFAGLLVSAAAGFTFMGMTRSREVIAVLTGGLSLYRVAAPVIVAGGILVALTLPLQEFAVPQFASKLARSKSQLSHETIQMFAVHYVPDSRGQLISAANFDPQRDMLEGFTLLKRDDMGRTVERISAEQAFWVGDNRWELTQGYAIRPTLPQDDSAVGGPVVGGTQEVTPVDEVWSDVSPSVLMARRAAIYPRLMSIVELRSMLGNQAVDAGAIQKIMHSRFSLLIVNVLVLVMGLPFFLTREPSAPALRAIQAAAVCMGMWGLSLVLLQADFQGLPAVTAAWLPLVVTLPVTAWLLGRVRT